MIISAAKASQAAEILGVELKTLSPDGLRAAWRDASKRLHPDVAENYDQQAWAQADWAHTVLKAWLEKHPKVSEAEPAKGDCRACGGSGRIAVGTSRTFGGKATTVQCVMCAGSGTLTEGQRGYYGRSE